MSSENSEVITMATDSNAQIHAPPPPALPPREEKPNIKPIYGMSTSLSTTLIFRQSEAYGMPRLSSQTAVYTNNVLDLEALVASQEAPDEFWLDVIRNYNDAHVRRNNLPDLELRLLDGIPSSLRGAVYSKVLQVKNGVDKSTYASLVKSVDSLKQEDFEIPWAEHRKQSTEILRVFEYCLRESAPIQLQETRRKTFRAIAAIVPLLQKNSGFEDQNVLAILFRISELITRFSKDEFAYKGCRGLEDVAKEQYLHIVTQGINLESLFKSIIYRFFEEDLDEDTKMTVLDLIVFEGFDCLLRLVVALFTTKKVDILSTNRDDLADFIFSKDLLVSINKDTLAAMAKTEFPMIVYENEFHLMSANSISSNDQELVNLKEIHDDLVSRRSDIIETLEGLKKTHQEIQIQNEDYEKQLKAAQSEREKLIEIHTNLQNNYARLTMQENLRNTVKANEDISKSNLELEQQIKELEASVEKKKTKISKNSR